MIKKIITIGFASCLVIFFISTTGCEKQDEIVNPEPVKVKSFKIEKPVVPSTSSTEEKQEGEMDDSKKSDLISDKVASDVNSQDVSNKPPVKSETEKNKSPVENLQVETDTLKKTDTSPEMINIPALALENDENSDSELAYNPVGRIDPFTPLFQNKNEKVSENTSKSQTIRDTRRGKLTPLEKMDISQLQLTAIILGQQRNIAMVQESTGKGHVVKKGTYIGINSGRVVEITKNTVVIEEEVEDLLGKIIVRKREMKLQKPLGEM